jgi:hypothetical protein
MKENDLERQLKERPLVQPSANLDQRIQALFDEAAFRRPRLLLRPVPIWALAAACLVCAFAGFGARSLFIPRQNPPTVVYVFPPNEVMTRLLTGPKANWNDDFDLSHARVEMIQPRASHGDQL